jgi:histidinol-phosphate/aromatic aminotransferase/cobyric acid decarboxylase-like protein
LVRFFDKPGLTDKLRITIGTVEQNDALLRALLG